MEFFEIIYKKNTNIKTKIKFSDADPNMNRAGNNARIKEGKLILVINNKLFY